MGHLMKSIKITVSGEDIRQAQMKRRELSQKNRHKAVHHCPVAIALRRVFHLDIEEVIVYPSCGMIGNLLITFPKSVEDFVVDYEKGLLIRSFAFDLPIPPDDLTYKSD